LARSDSYYALEIEKFLRYGLSELEILERMVFDHGDEGDGGDPKLSRNRVKRLFRVVARRLKIDEPGADVQLERAKLSTFMMQLAKDAAVKGDVANAANAAREFGKLLDLYPTRDKGAGKSLQELMALASAVNADGRVIERANDAAPKLQLAEDPYEGESDALPTMPEPDDDKDN
jgi:hypothetical protein